MVEINRRFQSAVNDMTNRPYDYLDFRQTVFYRHMNECEARLNDLKLFIGSYLERIYDCVWESPQVTPSCREQIRSKSVD